MQFPNNVNKSNLIKLGVLGVGMYLMNNRNKSQASTNQQQQQLDNNQQRLDNNQKQLDRQEKTTPFTLGKSLANKLLGKK